MEELEAYRADLLAALGKAVEELSNVAIHLPSAGWHEPVEPGSYAPHRLLFQLREIEEKVFNSQLQRFLMEPNEGLPIFDEEAWMVTHYRPEETVSAILNDLLRLRREELEWLRTLPVDSWARIARHPWWGEHTLQWWVELQLEYSLQCLRQLNRVDDS